MVRFPFSKKFVKRAILVTTGIGTLTASFLYVVPRLSKYRRARNAKPHTAQALAIQDKVIASPLISRDEQLQLLMNQDQEYDIVVIGGGATGCGIALDAISRGLRTALIERDDFASGASSRSTKLIHGGVRYLQKAVLQLDSEQYNMVKEALAERANLITIAPHLAFTLPIMLPIYKWWQLPYFWAGLKAYDLAAGTETLEPSYMLSKAKSLELFPMLKPEKLCGSLVYYDGMHNDSRMCLSVGLTAAKLGANLINHVEVIGLVKGDVKVTSNATDDEKKRSPERISGVYCQDLITGKEWKLRSKVVINATGCHTDTIRLMDDDKLKTICQPSSGVHVILPNYYSPSNMGLLDPSSSDGRVIFFLPWQNSTLAGTTDNACLINYAPEPEEKDLQFILAEIKNYLNKDINVRRSDVQSAWSGIRPLVSNPNSKTEEIARNHIIECSTSGMITIAGGKWTTYRSMAEQTVDKAVEKFNLNTTKGTTTKSLLLMGSHKWSPTMFVRLIQDHNFDVNVAQHLSNTYGDEAFRVATYCEESDEHCMMGKKLHPNYPYIEAEVHHSIDEYACSIVDVLARRTRLAFVNAKAAEYALPRVADIMAHRLNWSEKRKKTEISEAKEFLNKQMGLGLGDIVNATEAATKVKDE